MDCIVYRCAKQPEMYVYARTDVEVTDLPAPLLQRTGELTVAMELQLTTERKLAREDVNQVMQNLGEQGFHIQMPPNSVQVELHRGD